MRTLSECKKKRRTGSFRAGTVFCLLFALLFSLKAFAADGISMSVTYGYRDTAKNGQFLPVTITFENTLGDPVDGYAVMEVPGKDGTLSYTYPVSIPEGTSNRKFTVTVPEANQETSGTLFKVCLMDDQGEVFIEKEVPVSYHGDGRDILCGILSDDMESLLYFGNVSLGGNLSTKTVTLNPADIPEDAGGLSQLDMIVISAFDLSRLSGTVAEAIGEWALDGGTLVLGTGSRFTKGGFRDLLSGLTLSGGRYEDFDMGMEYSFSGPDGAVIPLFLRPLTWDGASPLFEHGDTPLLLYKETGKGRICVAACDLCDIAGFCAEHPGFSEDLAAGLFGPKGMSRLTNSMSSPEERTESAEELTNTFTAEKIPALSGYVAIAILYILITGPVLYAVLRNKGLGIFYMLGVIMLSAVTGLLVWILSDSTRIREPYIAYGMILSDDGSASGVLTADGAIRIGSPEKKALTLELSGETDVRPATVSGDISLASGKTRMLALTGQDPFEENLFFLEGPEESDALSLETHLYRDGLSFSGTVKNTGICGLHEVMLVACGEGIRIGELPAGEAVTLRGQEPLFGPVSNLCAFNLSSEQRGAKEKQQAELLDRFFKDRGQFSENDVFLLAFTEDYVPGVLRSSAFSYEGTVLYAVKAEVGTPLGTSYYVNSLAKDTPESSGSYDALTNTVSGTASTVLTYSLGNGSRIRSVNLRGLSESVSDGSLSSFRGQISIYNYINGAYDLIDAGKTSFSEEELGPYLSPANTMSLRFIPDEENNEDVKMYLPVPFIEREEMGSPAEDKVFPGVFEE